MTRTLIGMMAAAGNSHATIPDARGTGRCRCKKQRPVEILRAALRSFALHGFLGCRIDDIAADAGTSKGAIYMYFDSKASLFKAVVQDAIAPAFEFDRFEKLVAANRGSWSALLQHILEHWAEKLSQPEIAPSLRLLVSDAQTIPELATHCHEYVFSRGQRLIEQVLARGMSEYEFRALDEWQVAQALSAPFYLFALWPGDRDQFGCGKNDMRMAIRTCVELQIRGLGIEQGDHQ